MINIFALTDFQYHIMPSRKFFIIGLIAVLSGILLGISQYYFIAPLGWVAFAALFFAIAQYQLNLRDSFVLGTMASLIQALILFSWMITMTNHYTGHNSVLGYWLTFFVSLIFAIKLGLGLFIYSFILRSKSHSNLFNRVIELLATAASFVVLDWIYSLLFFDLPWMFHFVGYTQSTNIYFSQLAELGGVWLLSFVCVVINLIFAFALIEKKRVFLFGGSILIVVIHLYGFVRVEILNSSTEKPIKVALICDNTPPEIRWDETILNDYVHQLFKLNQEAISAQPDLIIWNEGVVPWSYRADDDFLKEILRQAQNVNTQHLISYYTVSVKNPESSFNSAYLLKNDGSVEGCYNKNHLLGGLEKPIWQINALQIPFFNSNINGHNVEGDNVQPIASKQLGNIGVSICNESLTDVVMNQQAQLGANFLVLMANDNWFADTQLTFHHFYVTRLRAIETRKDIAINANMGISGVIKATGEINQTLDATNPQVIVAEVTPNNNISYYTLRKTIFITCIFLILIVVFILKRKKHETH